MWPGHNDDAMCKGPEARATWDSPIDVFAGDTDTSPIMPNSYPNYRASWDAEVFLSTGLRHHHRLRGGPAESQVPALWSSGLCEMYLWPSGERDKPCFCSRQLPLHINPVMWALEHQTLRLKMPLEPGVKVWDFSSPEISRPSWSWLLFLNRAS